MSNRESGLRGEDLAALHLQQLGYRIIERNHRAPRGEIDLIALRDGQLTFVEVKYRKDLSLGHPAEAITHRKLASLRGAVGSYLANGEAPPHRELKFIAITILEQLGHDPLIEIFDDILGP